MRYILILLFLVSGCSSEPKIPRPPTNLELTTSEGQLAQSYTNVAFLKELNNFQKQAIASYESDKVNEEETVKLVQYTIGASDIVNRNLKDWPVAVRSMWEQLKQNVDYPDEMMEYPWYSRMDKVVRLLTAVDR